MTGQGKHKAAFSFVEILIVIAVIAIISAIVIPYIGGSTRYANEVIARQQQAELQTALGNWIAAYSSQPGGLAAARREYTNTMPKLSLLTNYLQPDTFNRFIPYGLEVRSAALDSSGATLYFSADWSVGESPAVIWSNR